MCVCVHVCVHVFARARARFRVLCCCRQLVAFILRPNERLDRHPPPPPLCRPVPAAVQRRVRRGTAARNLSRGPGRALSRWCEGARRYGPTLRTRIV